MPGGEYLLVLTDDGDQVIVTLGMNLNVGEQLELVGLQGADDLGFEVGSGAALSDNVGTEDVHLLMREVCVGKDGLDFDKTFAELLVTIPEMGMDGEATAEVQEREHRGGEVLALG